ncbi:Neuroligin-3 [Arthrobotrys entomopaga]|nr:Neuroligin-3 [Arthrobotrys entomopaga]
MKAIVLAGSLWFAASAATAPGPISLGSPLTILKENDLYGQYSNRTSVAILVEQPKTFASAKSACSSLSEPLWSPELQDFTAGVNNSLSYQAYLRKFSYSQQFWVADNAHDTCRAIDLAGKVRVLDCSRTLPALCAHSAPLSNISFWDDSEKYRVSVKTGDQTVTGFRDGFGFRFRSLRYAANPGRFKHTSVYNGVGDVDAMESQPICRQLHDGQDLGDEDCFFLNIATPYLPGADKTNLKPILFWIHGGSNVEVNGNLGNSDAINLATRGDIVVVKINYRLGHFGWLAIDGTSISGNYGLGDMITAMKWVHKNIEAFGGDPTRITIGGDSAAASDIRAIMASEAADGLYSAAIMHSVPIGYYPVNLFSHWLSIPDSTALFGPMLLDGTGCAADSTLQTCLTDVDPAILVQILSPVGHVAFPVVDNNLLKTTDLQVTGKGYVANVPLLIGVNRDETGILLAPYYGVADDPATFLDYIGQYVVFQNLSAFANSPLFPPPPGDAVLSAFNLTQRVVTDGGYKCLTWATAYSAIKHKVLPKVFTYEFNRTYSPTTFTNVVCEPPVSAAHPFGDPSAEYFKCHSGDLNFVHGELLYLARPIRDEFDIPFEQLVVDYWAAYVWNHDPNPKSGYLKARGYWGTLSQISTVGKWKAVNTREPSMMRLQWNGGSVEWDEKPQCEALGFPFTTYFETNL